MKDDEVTWVLTKIKYSIFTGYFGEYKNTIDHSEDCLLELEIQYGFSKFDPFCKRVVSISIYSIINFSFTSICTREDQITVKPMVFIPEVENKVIREAVSQK